MKALVSLEAELRINAIEKYAMLLVCGTVLWNARFESYVISDGIVAFLDDRQKIIFKVRNHTRIEFI